MAIIVEVLIPLAVFGLIAWVFWLRYRLKLARAEEAERMREQLSELRAHRRDMEARLQALETIATLGEDRIRVDYEDVPQEQDDRRGRKS
ncbi:MAG: hypothetical protein AMJ62_01630 [Myxococcales bacterium SG8_38]|nr:MAG: hypothetical protein AMJ62_01630 [Myxococcales bacterium SG8_38]